MFGIYWLPQQVVKRIYRAIANRCAALSFGTMEPRALAINQRVKILKSPAAILVYL
jgi:hypothetical protein